MFNRIHALGLGLAVLGMAICCVSTGQEPLPGRDWVHLNANGEGLLLLDGVVLVRIRSQGKETLVIVGPISGCYRSINDKPDERPKQDDRLLRFLSSEERGKMEMAAQGGLMRLMIGTSMNQQLAELPTDQFRLLNHLATAQDAFLGANFTVDQRARITGTYRSYRVAIQELEELVGQTAVEFRESLRQRELALIVPAHRDQLTEMLLPREVEMLARWSPRQVGLIHFLATSPIALDLGMTQQDQKGLADERDRLVERLMDRAVNVRRQVFEAHLELLNDDQRAAIERIFPGIVERQIGCTSVDYWLDLFDEHQTLSLPSMSRIAVGNSFNTAVHWGPLSAGGGRDPAVVAVPTGGSPLLSLPRNDDHVRALLWVNPRYRGALRDGKVPTDTVPLIIEMVERRVISEELGLSAEQLERLQELVSLFRDEEQGIEEAITRVHPRLQLQERVGLYLRLHLQFAGRLEDVLSPDQIAVLTEWSPTQKGFPILLAEPAIRTLVGHTEKQAERLAQVTRRAVADLKDELSKARGDAQHMYVRHVPDDVRELIEEVYPGVFERQVHQSSPSRFIQLLGASSGE